MMLRAEIGWLRERRCRRQMETSGRGVGGEGGGSETGYEELFRTLLKLVVNSIPTRISSG